MNTTRKARFLVIRNNGEHRSIHDTREEAERAVETELELDAKYIAKGWMEESWGYSVIPWSGRVW